MPNFVEQPKFLITCAQCLKLLQSPHQITCCGTRFCGECTSQIKATTISPTCKCMKPFKLFYDQSFVQSLKQIRVECTNQHCKKIMDYGDLAQHLNQNPSEGNEMKGCLYTQIKCRNKCGAFVSRHSLIKHEEIECSLVPQQQRTLLQEVVDAEIEAIRDEGKIHMHQLDAELVNLRDNIAKFGGSEMEYEKSSSVVPVIRSLEDFCHMKENNEECMLEPFYTHKDGYKIGICVIPNGYDEAKDSHVSLFTFILKGKNDDYLPWPFNGIITIQLLDHSVNKAHRQDTIRYHNFHPGYSNRVYFGSRCGGQGKYWFVSHASLDDRKHVQYLQNNSLHFRISGVKMQPLRRKESGWILIFVVFIIISVCIHLLEFSSFL